MERLIHLPGNLIRDESSFHVVSRQRLGFPDFYGNNMDAWLDCMSAGPLNGMTNIEAGVSALVIQIENGEELRQRCPQIIDKLSAAIRAVNERAKADPAIAKIRLQLD